MRCPHARNLMSPLLDGELDAPTRARLAAHMEGCAACRTAYAGLERVHAIFKEAGRHEPSPLFSRRVLAAARSLEGARRPPLLFALRLSAQAAMIAAVIAVGVTSGKFLTAPGSAASPASMFALDIFDAAPPDSPGGAYLALLEAGDE